MTSFVITIFLIMHNKNFQSVVSWVSKCLQWNFSQGNTFSILISLTVSAQLWEAWQILYAVILFINEKLRAIRSTRLPPKAIWGHHRSKACLMSPTRPPPGSVLPRRQTRVLPPPHPAPEILFRSLSKKDPYISPQSLVPVRRTPGLVFLEAHSLTGMCSGKYSPTWTSLQGGIFDSNPKCVAHRDWTVLEGHFDAWRSLVGRG